MASRGALVVRFIGDTRDFERAQKKVTGGVGRFVKTATLVAAGTGIAKLGMDAIRSASDMNETLNKSRVIFGRHAKAVERWSQTSDRAMGLSQQAALEAASSYGDMFSQLGFTGREATRMSKSVVQMAADLGSFNNLSTDDVLERIAGGFRGEYDALQKLIPNISAARVQQVALARTHKKSAQDLTAAEKAEATLAIIRKDGARATGDFARTSGGLANQQKILGAQTDNLKAAIGSRLLPVAVKITTALNKFIGEMRTGEGAGGQFVDVLKDAATVGKGVLSFLNGLPGPVKKFGVEALIAYGILRKLGPAVGSFGTSVSTSVAKVKQFGAEMTYAETRMQRVATASQAVGSGIRNLAGVGGMMLLAKSAGESNRSVATLTQTLGGAATGFALGGPIGAGVGGLAGLMLGLATNTGRSAKAAANSIPRWQAYISTLDDATAAITHQTTAAIQETIRSRGLNKVLDDYGFTNRQIVQAIKSGGPLRQRMIADLKAEESARARAGNAIIKQHGASSQEWKDFAKSNKARADAVTLTLKELGAVSESVAKKREDIAATRTFTKAIKALPARVETFVRTVGLKPGISGVVELARQIRLTPDEIRILIRENGGKGTDAEIRRVQDRAAALGRMTPTVNVGAKTGQARAELGSFYKYLLNITKARTVNVRVKTGRPGGAGALLDQGVHPGKNDPASRIMEDAGRSAGDSYARGVEKRRMKVKKALEMFSDLASKAADKVASLQETRAGFLSTFQADSVFSADLSNGGGIGALIEFQRKQALDAQQLVADIQKAASMGLSKSLISQLQAQGTSGAQQLHAIASGSVSQVQYLNSLNAATTSALSSAGMLAGNIVRGGSINADIASAKAEDARLERLVRALRKASGDDTVVINIDSEQIIKVIKKRNRRKGVATAGI